MFLICWTFIFALSACLFVFTVLAPFIAALPFFVMFIVMLCWIMLNKSIIQQKKSNYYQWDIFCCWISQDNQVLVKERSESELFAIINGETFFPLNSRVREVKLAFWKNSISHRDTINLKLFCLSNRYSPHLITKRLLLSNLGPCKSRKDGTPDRVCGQLCQNKRDHNKLLYLNNLQMQ